MSKERSNMEEMDNVIILNDEVGNPFPVEVLGVIEYEGEEYVVFYPCDDTDQEGEVIILKIAEADDAEEAYVSVDDEEIVTTVFELFKEKFKDQFHFAD